MKKYATMWVPNLTELTCEAKKLRSLTKLDPLIACAFDPKNGSFVYAMKEEIYKRVYTNQCFQIPKELGTESEKEFQSATYIRTQILAYAIDHADAGG